MSTSLKSMIVYCKTLSGHSKIIPKYDFNTNYRLMQVKSIAECSALHIERISVHVQYNLCKQPLSKYQKLGFQGRLSLNAGQKYCRMHSETLSIFIKLPFVIPFVLSIFEWPF